MKPIYVDSADPVEEVEAFITKFQVDDNFRPLARLLRRFSRNVVSDTVLDATVRAAFSNANSSLEETAGVVTLTISALPANNGSAVNLVQYRVAPETEYTSVVVSTLPMTVTITDEVTSGEVVTAGLRAVNGIGPSANFNLSVTAE